MSDLSELVKEGWLKRGNLEKRAQEKSVITRAGFKRRAFILLRDSLLYLDSADLKKTSIKGRIPLDKIRAIEVVDGSVYERKFMLQVVHDDAILYMSAENRRDRDEWIEALREACMLPANFASKYELYHSGVFSKNEWTCCHLKGKPTGGCERAHVYKKKSGDTSQTATAAEPSAAPRSSLDKDDYIDLDNESDDDADPDEQSNRMLGDGGDDGDNEGDKEGLPRSKGTSAGVPSRASTSSNSSVGYIRPSFVTTPQLRAASADAPVLAAGKIHSVANASTPPTDPLPQPRQRAPSKEQAAIYEVAVDHIPKPSATATASPYAEPTLQRPDFSSLNTKPRLAADPATRGVPSQPEDTYAHLNRAQVQPRQQVNPLPEGMYASLNRK